VLLGAAKRDRQKNKLSNKIKFKRKKKSYCFVPKGSHTAFNTNYVTNRGQNADNVMINKKTTISLKC